MLTYADMWHEYLQTCVCGMSIYRHAHAHVKHVCEMMEIGSAAAMPYVCMHVFVCVCVRTYYVRVCVCVYI